MGASDDDRRCSAASRSPQEIPAPHGVARAKKKLPKSNDHPVPLAGVVPRENHSAWSTPNARIAPPAPATIPEVIRRRRPTASTAPTSKAALATITPVSFAKKAIQTARQANAAARTELKKGIWQPAKMSHGVRPCSSISPPL